MYKTMLFREHLAKEPIKEEEEPAKEQEQQEENNQSLDENPVPQEESKVWTFVVNVVVLIVYNDCFEYRI